MLCRDWDLMKMRVVLGFAELLCDFVQFPADIQVTCFSSPFSLPFYSCSPFVSCIAKRVFPQQCGQERLFPLQIKLAPGVTDWLEFFSIKPLPNVSSPPWTCIPDRMQVCALVLLLFAVFSLLFFITETTCSGICFAEMDI